MPKRRRRSRKVAREATRLALPFLRRRSTRWLVAAVITLAVGILLGVYADRTGGGNDGDDGAGPVSAPTLEAGITVPDIDPPAAGLERADVLGVVDGDTIDVRIDGREERVRYYGVDTPERGDDCFDEATRRNEQLADDTVLLLPDARERDSFGRLLRYVFDSDGESIDARLIAEGLGEAWRADGAYRDDLVALAEDVWSLGAGCLWSSRD